MAILSKLGKYKNTALLLMRVGLGIMFITHGYPKLLGGPDGWRNLGMATKHIGIDFFPLFFGLMAALTETLGGFLVLIGLAFRPVCAFLVINLLVATFMHLGNGEGLSGASHALEMAIVFLGLLFLGPGRYSVDKK
jgi:putative oxidoreductase